MAKNAKSGAGTPATVALTQAKVTFASKWSFRPPTS
jgi:hypothetical protein